MSICRKQNQSIDKSRTRPFVF